MLPDAAYFHVFNYIDGLGPRRVIALLSYFNNRPQDIWEYYLDAPPNLIPQKSKNLLRKWKRNNNIEQEWSSIFDQSIQTVTILDDDYPQLLKEIPTPPPLLYFKGVLPKLQPLITVVGTRTITDYGRQVVRHLLDSICRQGIGIISGLAFGIDEQAHRIAVDNNSYTAAILGSGVERITPYQQEPLGKEIIAQGGGIISEFRPGSKISHGNFPRRNRLLAGISPLTIIIEAASRSGALITAHYALDFNREVAAIPGSIFSPISRGCNKLIKQGAHLVASPQDILELLPSLNLGQTDLSQDIKLNEKEKKVLSLLTDKPQPIDVLAINWTDPSSELIALLSQLEIKGLVVDILGRGYKKG